MPEQPPPDEQPTSPDLSAEQPSPAEQTIPLAQQADASAEPPPQPGYAAPATPRPVAAPKPTYQLTRGLIAGAAAAVLLVGGITGYAIGATVVANDSPDRTGPSRVDWNRDPGGEDMQQGPRGWFGGPQGGFGGQWSSPKAGMGDESDSGSST